MALVDRNRPAGQVRATTLRRKAAGRPREAAARERPVAARAQVARREASAARAQVARREALAARLATEDLRATSSSTISGPRPSRTSSLASRVVVPSVASFAAESRTIAANIWNAGQPATCPASLAAVQGYPTCAERPATPGVANRRRAIKGQPVSTAVSLVTAAGALSTVADVQLRSLAALAVFPTCAALCWIAEYARRPPAAKRTFAGAASSAMGAGMPSTAGRAKEEILVGRASPASADLPTRGRRLRRHSPRPLRRLHRFHHFRRRPWWVVSPSNWTVGANCQRSRARQIRAFSWHAIATRTSVKLDCR
jgi:hypothetical protein